MRVVERRERAVAVGVDGSPASLAAAGWAAGEAVRRGLPLRLVHVLERAPAGGPGTEDRGRRAAGELLRSAAAGLGEARPGLRVEAEALTGDAVPVLADAAQDAELLVLGSRALGPLAGFLLGSAASAVVARAARPVVLVREGTGPGGEGPVVLGLDLERPCEELCAFAFEAAGIRGAPLHAVHAWDRYEEYGRAAEPLHERVLADLEAAAARRLAAALAPWRTRHPGVRVHETARPAHAADALLEASASADLLVVGRRARRTPLPPYTGPVTSALLHHAGCAVAVVPCG